MYRDSDAYFEPESDCVRCWKLLSNSYWIGSDRHDCIPVCSDWHYATASVECLSCSFSSNSVCRFVLLYSEWVCPGHRSTSNQRLAYTERPHSYHLIDSVERIYFVLTTDVQWHMILIRGILQRKEDQNLILNLKTVDRLVWKLPL